MIPSAYRASLQPPLPTYIRYNRAHPNSDTLYQVCIENIKGFPVKKFTCVVPSLDDALFYRNLILDCIERKRPDNLEPSATHQTPREVPEFVYYFTSLF